MSFNNGKKIGGWSAAAIVVANMIGTGVFTSLGFQLNDVQNTWSILLLWTLGGIFALLGAFSYAELGSKLPKSGGEYHFLSKLFHPFLGYLSGWVSLTVGFSAPIALGAMALGAYTVGPIALYGESIGWFSSAKAVAPTLAIWIALLVIIVISLIHSFNIKQSSLFQNVFTLIKVLFLITMIGLALWHPATENALSWDDSWKAEIFTPWYAVALVYVTYSYTGWSAAAYIVEEIRRPKINLPKALIGGTLFVSVLYVLLQLAFLNQATVTELQSRVEIGQVVGNKLFGKQGGDWFSFLIAFFLISSISAMVWVGPRVTRAMGNDYRLWRFLGRDNSQGIPVRAIWFQSVISLVLIATSSFEQVLLYSGFILQLFSAIAVAGVFVLRFRKNYTGYESPFYPWIQMLYLLASAWIIFYLIYERPSESLSGIFNLLIGALTYAISFYLFPEKPASSPSTIASDVDQELSSKP